MAGHNNKNMGKVSPHNKTDGCTKVEDCYNFCPRKQLFCVQRSAFHVALARLGKTALTDAERQLLAVDNPVYGGHLLPNWNISNTLFVYEQTTLRGSGVWQGLASFLGMPELRHDRSLGEHGNRKQKKFAPNLINICAAEWDGLRSELMQVAYDLSRWMLEYFIPAAGERQDIVIHNVTEFAKLVGGYQLDPCGRLEQIVNSQGDARYALSDVGIETAE